MYGFKLASLNTRKPVLTPFFHSVHFQRDAPTYHYNGDFLKVLAIPLSIPILEIKFNT